MASLQNNYEKQPCRLESPQISNLDPSGEKSDFR